jgi:hypothetical protein
MFTEAFAELHTMLPRVVEEVVTCTG